MSFHCSRNIQQVSIQIFGSFQNWTLFFFVFDINDHVQHIESEKSFHLKQKFFMSISHID